MYTHYVVTYEAGVLTQHCMCVLPLPTYGVVLVTAACPDANCSICQGDTCTTCKKTGFVLDNGVCSEVKGEGG